MVSKLTKVFGLRLHEDQRDLPRSPRKRRHLDSSNDVATDSLVTPHFKRVRFSDSDNGDEAPVISRIASWVKMKATQFSSNYLVRPLPNGMEAESNGPVDHNSRDDLHQVPNRSSNNPTHRRKQNNGTDTARYQDPATSVYARHPLHGPRHNGPQHLPHADRGAQHLPHADRGARKRTHRRHHDQTGNLQAPDLPVLENKVENWCRMHSMRSDTATNKTSTAAASSTEATSGSQAVRGGPFKAPVPVSQSPASRHSRGTTPTVARLQNVSLADPSAGPQGPSTVHDRLFNSTVGSRSMSLANSSRRSDFDRVPDRQDYRELLEQYTAMNLDGIIPGRNSLLLDRTTLHRTQQPPAWEGELRSGTRTANQPTKLPNKVPRPISPITFDLTSRSSSPIDLRSMPAASPPSATTTTAATAATVVTSKPSQQPAVPRDISATIAWKYSSWVKDMKERFESSIRITGRKTQATAAGSQYRENKELERRKTETKVQEIISGVKEYSIEDLESEFPVVEPDLEPEEDELVISVISVAESEESEVFPELTAEMQTEVDSALCGGQPSQELVSGFRIQLTRADFQTLDGLNWLNDEVINFYFNLLADRSQNNDDLPSVHTFNTFFYPKLLKDGYTSLRRWTKRVDVFSKDILLVPVHLGVHWCLAVIDFRSKCITYYDSMGCINDKCLNALREYLTSEHQDKKKSPYDVSDWELVHAKDIPVQMNGSDCGVFACKFAEYATRNKLPTFNQEHMPYFRRRMVWELLHKKLL